tara:strand:- start:130 stop:819 length:690 start_codon:yes stop_codon:yes gene_type:complete
MLDKILGNVDRTLVRNLVILHTLVIAVSNYLVTIQFNVFPGANLPLFGEFPLAAAAFTFPIVVVATDLTVRLVGKEAGRAVVAMAIIPAIIASVLVLLALGDEHAYRVGIASGSAYAIGTMLDVYVFQYIREKYTEAWWAAPAFSTVAANIIDTYSFFFVAFAGSTDAEGNLTWIGANWHIVAQNNTLTKIVVGLIVFLPAYGLLLSFLGEKGKVKKTTKKTTKKKTKK